MAKAINWPQEFYDEVMAEDMTSPKIAVRLGSLYFDNVYYYPNELVDVRVDHKIVRKAQIIGDMKLLKIKDISAEDMQKYKKSMSNKSEMINFLAKNYNKEVNEETEVTLITYKNLDITSPEDDDPHM